MPSVVARDLDRDPEQLSLICLPLLRYAEAKAEFDHAKDDKQLERWRGSSVMDAVKKNTFELAQERRKRFAAAPGVSPPSAPKKKRSR